MEKEEKEFIYKQMNYLKEQLQYQQEFNKRMLQVQGKTLDVVEGIQEAFEKMMSPEFAKNQQAALKAVEIEEKVALIKKMMKSDG